MAGPTVAWDDFTLDELLPHGPLSAALLTKLRNNQEHLYEVAHAGGYGGGSAHTHASSGAATLDMPIHENLIRGSCPGNNMRSDAWTLSGFRNPDDFEDNVALVIGGDSSGETIYQSLGGDDDEAIAMFGTDTADGMDCVISFFIQPLEGAMAAGALSFGFADNSTSTFTDSAPVAYTDLSEGWTRVYSRFTQGGQGHSTDVRFLVRTTTGFTNGISLCGFQLNRGRQLVPWTISNVEGKYANNGNVNYLDMPDAPILDQRIAMHDAVDVTP